MKERKRILEGRVVSNRMTKTVVVVVERQTRHKLYGKVVTVRTRFKAHDEESRCQIGDLVRIVEARPLSHEKRWLVTEVLEKA
ncbi:MAG TPA: 30S ribosomal protein S17 [Anaerolineae bacterium]|nr:30S ribosomal protein S17 [Anaerolineae bacterium]